MSRQGRSATLTRAPGLTPLPPCPLGLLDQVNTVGVYAAMSKKARMRMTSSIFRKWKARGGLTSPGVQYLDLETALASR